MSKRRNRQQRESGAALPVRPPDAIAQTGTSPTAGSPAEPPSPSTPQPVEQEIVYPDGRIEHPSVNRERSDAWFGGVLAVIVAFVCVAALQFYLILLFFRWQAGAESEQKQSPFPLAATPSTRLPPEPRLEQIDRLLGIETPNVFKRDAANEQLLNSYGPTAEQGFVHVPIQRAMEMMAGELPVRPQSERSAGNGNGLLDAGDSNSGRILRGPVR